MKNCIVLLRYAHTCSPTFSQTAKGKYLWTRLKKQCAKIRSDEGIFLGPWRGQNVTRFKVVFHAGSKPSEGANIALTPFVFILKRRLKRRAINLALNFF